MPTRFRFGPLIMTIFFIMVEAVKKRAKLHINFGMAKEISFLIFIVFFVGEMFGRIKKKQ